ncbi:helix-hairpin-helix domain-containing protein [Nocardiopsis sp. CNT312]|uniref:helix-hairpin-helix domain-containing protein n=1 Tax=Nocardiopsis sp. CNT312 TaxID=1137268 RepID=UPI00048AA378|nr:helix-hairpin-helix domain-containing protein [Nocardiopsis sp. CNT312]
MSEAVEQVSAVLDRMGAPPSLAPRLVAALGPGAAAELDADPWLLLRLPRVSVEQADFCARRHLGPGARPDDPRRLGALTAHVLRQAAARGHTALEERRLATIVGKTGAPDPAAALEAAEASGSTVVFESTDEGDEDFDFEDGVPEVPEAERFHALPDLGHAEQRLGAQVARLVDTGEPVMDALTAEETARAEAERHGFALGGELGTAVVTAALRPVTVLLHGPGDAAEVARALLCLHGIGEHSEVGCAVAAPTAQGASAVAADLGRLTDSAPPVVPLARLLAAPVTAGLVVVCEAMALDTVRMAELVSACPDGTQLVLAADPRQAPSAGPGRVVADLVASRTAHTAVLEVNGPVTGPLTELAWEVAGGSWTDVEAPEREVVRVPAASPEETVHRVLQLLTDSIPRALDIGSEHVQVVAVREDGPAGTAAVNAACKERLNPGPGEHGGLDVGDRVLLAAGGPGYTRGDVGYLRAVDGGVAAVELADGSRVDADPGALRPGWAVTVAAAHGSRWPSVVLALTPDAPLSRPLVYTALTRAVRHVSVVDASGGGLEAGVRDNPGTERTTRLVGVLREA